jgi:hypothetical protein
VLYGSHHDFFVIINAMAVIIYYDCHRAIQNNYHCHSSIRNNSSFYSSIPEITVIITSSSPSSSPGILVRTAILTTPIIFELYIATDCSLCYILIIIISIYLNMPPSTPKPLMPLWALAHSILTISPNRLQEHTTSLACLIQGQ